MTITVFGVSMVVGFIISGFFLWKRALEEHLSEREVFDIYIVASLWALLAARIIFIGQRFSQFGWNPWRWLSIFSIPGLDGSSALLVGVAMIALAAIKRGWDPWLILDAYLGPIMLWQAISMAVFNWMLGIYWAGWFLLLWWIEREYRLWDWYRGRKGSAKPGLITSAWLIGVGSGLIWLARLGVGMLFLTAEGWTLCLAGLVIGYHRSGRVVKTDISHIISGLGRNRAR